MADADPDTDCDALALALVEETAEAVEDEERVGGSAARTKATRSCERG